MDLMHIRSLYKVFTRSSEKQTTFRLGSMGSRHFKHIPFELGPACRPGLEPDFSALAPRADESTRAQVSEIQTRDILTAMMSSHSSRLLLIPVSNPEVAGVKVQSRTLKPGQLRSCCCCCC